MRPPVINPLGTILVLVILTFTVDAEGELPSFNISITPQEQEQALQVLLQKSLRKARDRLNQSGITMTGDKLIRRELGTLVKVLNSEGYYRHHIDFDKTETTVNYYIETGRMYRVSDVVIESSQADITLPTPEQIGLHSDVKLRAARVLEARDALHQFIREHNCLYQINTDYEVILHHESATGDVRFLVKPSPQVNVGNISIDGLETVRESHVRGKLGLVQGQCYQTLSIEKARLRLLQTGLFTLVNSRVTSPADGRVDLGFELRESHHRTIKAGVGYSTDESISFTSDWQHRNIFGRAEVLELEGKVSKLFKTVGSTLTYPTFMRSDQALVLEGELADENLDAYDSQGMTVTATLKRKLGNFLTASAGIQYKFKSVQESGGENTFGLISLPVSLGFDNRENILDPRRGWVASVAVQPYVDSLNTDIMFLKSTVGASIYHTFEDFRFSPTLAARSVIGMINGIDTDSVPASDRFYAGGGGSVRGYPFQKLGPLEDGDPRGGRSLLEFSLEARMRINKNWGGVVFIDGGNVYDDQFPRFDKGVRWAAGIGARYYTSFAPVRLDIGFPINRRSVDDRFQIYISLAQAF